MGEEQEAGDKEVALPALRGNEQKEFWKLITVQTIVQLNAAKRGLGSMSHRHYFPGFLWEAA